MTKKLITGLNEECGCLLDILRMCLLDTLSADVQKKMKRKVVIFAKSMFRLVKIAEIV